MHYPFDDIIEKPWIVNDLVKYNLFVKYKKNKDLLLAGFRGKLDFKLRKPRSAGIYAFRINKKYRALGKIVDNNLCWSNFPKLSPFLKLTKNL